MKAEHRKELETNALADRVGRAVHGMKQAPQKRTMIGLVALVIVVAVVVLVYRRGQVRKAENSERWIEFAAGPGGFLQRALKDEPDSTQAKAAMYEFLYDRLRESLRILATNPKQALNGLDELEKYYQSLAQQSKDDKVLLPEALYCQAVIEETRIIKNDDKWKSALAAYQDVATNHKETAFGKLARERVAALENKDKREAILDVYRDLRREFVRDERPLDFTMPPLPPEGGLKTPRLSNSRAAYCSERTEIALILGSERSAPMAANDDDLDDELIPLPGVGRAVDVTVQAKTAGRRLDLYLAALFPDFSRSLIQKAIEADSVTVNEAPTKASFKVRVGDRVRVWLPEPAHGAPAAEDIPLDILYEDEFLAIINKPFNMVVHPAKGNWSGTLVNALRFHFSALSTCNGAYRAGIVHRLDRDTSGVILVAKEEATHRDLALQFETRKVFKEYIAITAGVLDRDSDYIERRIGHHPRDRVKMMVTDDEDDGKEASSFYEVIERFRGHTFCKIQPKTGRTHQIRVHLASVGCPVLADKIYSGRDQLRLSDLVEGLDPTLDEVFMGRQALHAHRLRINHPKLKRVIAVEAPLPEEFQKTLAALRRYKGGSAP